MSIFLVLIILIGWILSIYYGDPGILYFAVFFSLFANFFSYWYSDKIALAASGAKKLEKNDNRELWNIVENLSITAGLPMPNIYIINDSSPNAFATGRDKEHASIAFTSGLLSILERNELEGVVAHELSHIGNRDILLQSIVVVLVGSIALVSDILLRSMFFRGDRDNKAGGMMLIVGLVLAILSPIVATIIQLAVSRKREFLADASGALLTRYPEGLASALIKISANNVPMKKANNATAHLFIANPFGAKAKKGLAKLFMTHPPVEDRVKALRS
ncbi:MAG: M48 family metallopeptidase [Candidatus Pacebacteria bacterium]|nr:M48 family metallopeptidase [Candidatus Paceibacterota bacterium]